MIGDDDEPQSRSVNSPNETPPTTPQRNSSNVNNSTSSSSSTPSSLVRRASAAFDRLRRSASRPSSPSPTQQSSSSTTTSSSNHNNNNNNSNVSSSPPHNSPRSNATAVFPAWSPTVRGRDAANQFYIRVFPNAVLSRASPPDAPLRCWVVPMPPAAADLDDSVGATNSTGNSIADSFEIDESDTFQFLWTAFAHVLNESAPLDVQLIVRTPAGTDRKIFGKINDEDVKMGLPCGLPPALRSSTLESTSPVSISRADSVDLAGTEDLLAALDSIDIDDICSYNAEPLPNSHSSLSISPPSPTSSTSSQQQPNQQQQQSTQQQQQQQQQTSPPQQQQPTVDESSTLTNDSPLNRSSSTLPSTSDVAPGVDAMRGSSGSAPPANTVFPMYFSVSFPDIVVKALDRIQRSGHALPIDEIRLPREALKVLPLKSNRHNSTMRAVLYRGSWLDDKTYTTLDNSGDDNSNM